MATVYTDDFSGNLDDWEDDAQSPPSAWATNGGVLDPSTAEGCIRIETAAYTFPDDIKVSIDIATTFSSFDGGPVTRCTEAGDSTADCYYGDAYSPNKIEIYRRVNGSDTKVSGSNQLGMADGDTLRLESEGTAHRLYHNGTLKTNGTDSQHSTGQAGVFTWSAIGLFDNFSVDDFAAAGTRRVMVIGWKEALVGMVVGALVKNPVTTRRFWFFLLALLLLASPVVAKDLYVDQEGVGGACSDAGARDRAANSITTPWCSFGPAGIPTNVLAGDTVHVRAGTYSTPIDQAVCTSCQSNTLLQINSEGSDGNWITVQPYQNEHVILTRDAGPPYATYAVQLRETYDDAYNPDWVRIHGFHIQDIRYCIKIGFNVSNLWISGNYLDNCGLDVAEDSGTGGSGIVAFTPDLETHFSDLLIEDNTVINSELEWEAAIHLNGCAGDNIIRRNFLANNSDVSVEDTDGGGIIIDLADSRGSGTCTNLIENNVVWDHEGYCADAFKSSDVTIRNNTCVRNGRITSDGDGLTFEIRAYGDNVEVYNNLIFARSGVLNITAQEHVDDCTDCLDTMLIDNNLYWNDVVDPGPQVRYIGTAEGNSGAITPTEFAADSVTYGFGGANPWAVDRVEGNPQLITSDSKYYVASDSPAIDAGVNAECSTEDISERPRPFDGDENGTATCDIGAHEFKRLRMSGASIGGGG